MDDETIRALVTRLKRSHPSGGESIERAAILAEGTDCTEVVEWIIAHGGEPELAAKVRSGGGLHSGRLSVDRRAPGAAPLRYVLPPGSL